MTDKYVVVREQAARDLIDLSRQAAAVLNDRGSDAQDRALADALTGSAAEVATDIAEPVLR